MTALLDFDWGPYRVCFGGKGKDLIQIIDTLEYYIHDIQNKTGVSDYRMFLTGKSNFRYEIATIQEYKGDRKNKEKPKYFYEVRDYLITEWKAEVSDGVEAEDLCGINQTNETIIVGEDKDLLMIPGWHYRIKRDWSLNHKIYISEDEAMFNFYKQMIIGDRIDSIPKIPKLGEVKATKLLENKTNEERLEIVQDLYKKHYQDNWYARFDEVARLLWILRDPEKTYTHYI